VRVLRQLLLLLVIPVLALGQATIPSTNPGKVLQGWLDTFNAGDVDRRAKFIEEHYADSVLEGAKPEQMARRMLRFREMVGGGFDLFKVTQSSDTEIKAILKEKGGFG
jgi:hypothetical protein